MQNGLSHVIDERDDFYTRLGLSRNARNEDIRKSYFSLARRLHPDKQRHIANRNEDSEYAFRLVKEAYDTLSHIEERQFYDQHLARYGPPQWGGPGGADDDDDEHLADLLHRWEADQGAREAREGESLRRQFVPSETVRERTAKAKETARMAARRCSDDFERVFTRLFSASVAGEGRMPSRHQRKQSRNHDNSHRRQQSGHPAFRAWKDSQLPDHDSYFNNDDELTKCLNCGEFVNFSNTITHQRVCPSGPGFVSTQEQTGEYNDSDETNQFPRDLTRCPFCQKMLTKQDIVKHLPVCLHRKHSLSGGTLNSLAGDLKSKTATAKEYAKSIQRPKMKTQSENFQNSNPSVERTGRLPTIGNYRTAGNKSRGGRWEYVRVKQPSSMENSTRPEYSGFNLSVSGHHAAKNCPS